MSFAYKLASGGCKLLALALVTIFLWLWCFPIIYCNREINLGEAHVGNAFNTWLRVTNIGFRNVTIVHGKTSCLCTHINFNGIPLPPFTEVAIPIKVQTGNLSGNISEYTIFEVNAGLKRQYQTKLNGKILKSIDLEGCSQNLGAIPIDELAKVIKLPFLLAESAVDIAEIAIEHCDQPLQAKIRGFDTSEEILEIDISKLPIGTFTKQITLCGKDSTGNKMFAVNTSIIGLVTGRWFSDKSLIMCSAEGKSEASFTVKCPLSVKSDSVQVFVEPQSLANILTIRLDQFPKISVFVHDDKPQNLKDTIGRIVVASRGSEKESVEVPILIR